MKAMIAETVLSPSMTSGRAGSGGDLSGLLTKRGRLFVVSGPSGVGKDAVLSALLASVECPPGLVRCITATTRPPRPTEIPGRDYFFFTHSEFEQRIRSEYFLEHAVYNSHYYGTPHDYPEQVRDEGHDVLLKIEVQGALTVKSRVPDAILIFLAPPSWEELERRLRSRATDDEVEVLRRLEIARAEMAIAVEYDFLVINDQIDDAVRALTSIVLAERCRIQDRPDGESLPLP
jgi:guanylate kinase